jgi:tRNA threonylcarbamoyladenosine biosynthesis protein TsaB
LNILTIDTATDFELISVTSSGKTYQFAENVKMSHSVTMFDSIKRILDEASISIKEISLIGVGIGPGSFTGVRIAVSTARMIAQILDIPLVGVTTQDIFAASAPSNNGEKVLVAFDAKKSRVFGALYYEVIESSTKTLIDAGDFSMEYMLKPLSVGDHLLCIGDGCSRYREIISSCSDSAGFRFRIIEDFVPSGAITSQLVLQKYNETPEKYRSYENTWPLYARKSDAEIALNEKNRGIV